MSDQPLPVGLRRTLLVLGGATSGVAGLAFLFPSWLVDRFGWPLTLLTTRTFMAWLLVFGALMLSMVVEDDRARVRLATPSLILVLPAVLLQLLRYSDQVDWANAPLCVLLAAFAVMSGCGAYLARGDWRQVLGSPPSG